MRTVEKLSVTLPRELAEKVRGKVATGEYASQSEIIRAALRLWQDREELKERKLADLREKIDRSLGIRIRRSTRLRPSPIWMSALASDEASLSPQCDRRSRGASQLHCAGRSRCGPALCGGHRSRCRLLSEQPYIGRERSKCGRGCAVSRFKDTSSSIGSSTIRLKSLA
jgi:antitoxin ParD1/3/4